jgi:drug/metabolite transporter (DMT)-like permease
MLYALITTLAWGLWGTFGELPAKHGFPESLSYVIWAITMTLPAAIVLRRSGWHVPFDGHSLALGLTLGLSGSLGVILLFPALSIGPAYLIFPIISLAPAVTIAFTALGLGERTGRVGVVGIAMALLALPFLNDWQPGQGFGQLGLWFVLSLGILFLWGLQNFLIKLAHRRMNNAAVFFYMTLGGIVLIPVALWRTDWHGPINLGWDGAVMSAAIQLLNAVGSLSIVYALREGKAIIVAPLTNAMSPLITTILAMLIHGQTPDRYKLFGIAAALVASALLAIQAE